MAAAEGNVSKESLGEPALSSSRPLPDDLRMSAVLCVVSPVARTFYRVGKDLEPIYRYTDKLGSGSGRLLVSANLPTCLEPADVLKIITVMQNCNPSTRVCVYVVSDGQEFKVILAQT